MNTKTVSALAVDTQRLVRLLLDEPWHAQCEIIPASAPMHISQPRGPMPANQKIEATGLAVGAGFGEVLARMKAVNERLRVLKSLPPIKHTGDQDAFESAQTERLAEEISTMAESLDAMKQMDALLSSPAFSLTIPGVGSDAMVLQDSRHGN